MENQTACCRSAETALRKKLYGGGSTYQTDLRRLQRQIDARSLNIHI